MDNNAISRRGQVLLFLGLVLMIIGGIAYWSVRAYFAEGNFRTADDIDMGRIAIGLLGILAGIVGIPMFIGGLIQFFSATAAGASAPKPEALSEELGRLQLLRDQGTLSEDEFREAKNRTLGAQGRQ